MSAAPRPSPMPAAVPAPARAAAELQLLRQVAAGALQAFDTFYQCYAPYLRCFLRRRLPDPDLVDDVCHEVLLLAWQQAARFQPQARLSTWLCGIAQHRVQKAWQWVARQQAMTLLTSPAGDPAADPEVLLLHQEQHQGLARARVSDPEASDGVLEGALAWDRRAPGQPACNNRRMTTSGGAAQVARWGTLQRQVSTHDGDL